jgi:hydrocephalus-inducing protein
VCEVEGGPAYDVEVQCEASTIKYAIDNPTMHFGQALFHKTIEKDVQLHNTGRVPFPFKVSTEPLQRKSVLDIRPMEGRLGPGEKVTFKMKITPGIPDRIVEKFHIQVAHFEPEEVSIVGEGIYPTVQLNVPHVFDLEGCYEGFLEQARSRLVQRGPVKGAPSALPAPPKTGRPATSTSAAAEGGASRTSSRLGARGAEAPWEPSLAEMEAEADRLQLCALLTTHEQALHAVARAKQLEATGEVERSGKQSLEERLAAAEAPKAPAAKTLPRAKSAGKKSKAPKAEEQIISRYFCDFGCVVKGTNKVKKLKLQNITSQQVSYAIDKKLIPPGFIIDPESVQKLPGAPEYEVLDLTVTLQTGSLSVGELRHVVPVPIRLGPPIELHLVANIQTPELEVSSRELDFGRVQVGQCKAMWVQLFNPKDVPADWAVRKPMEKVRDWSFFSAAPSSGTLQPGERVNVQMMYEPGASRNEYAQDVPIKISQNKRELRVVCKGESYTLGLRCEPAAVDLGAILPGAEAPKEAFFRLCNDSEVPIEVFSLDFDQQYLADDEVLVHADGYSETNRLLLEPRSAGSGLWPNLVEANTVRKELIRAQQEAEAAEAATEAAAAAADGEQGDGAEATKEIAAEEGDKAVTEEVGELEMPVAEEVEAPKDATASALDTTTNILCMGPCIAGKTTQAASLAARYGAKVMVIEEILSELMQEGAEQVHPPLRFPSRPSDTLNIPTDPASQPGRCGGIRCHRGQ